MDTPAAPPLHIIHATEDVTVLMRKTTPSERFRDGFERHIIHTATLMTVVINIDNGPWAEPDPMHSHPHEQTAYVAQGDILFLCQGQEPVRLTAGDLYAIPPNIPHSIQLLSKTACLIDNFTPLREDFL
jgi:quercetin dioxygenase-like cupin family protein